MTDPFIFPYSFEEILKQSDTRYSVAIEKQNVVKNMDDRKIQNFLNKLQSSFVDYYTELQKNDKFDTLYFLIESFGNKNRDSPNLNKFSMETIESTGDLLTQYLNSLLRRNLNQVEISDYRQCFKMIIFLTIFYLRNTCIKRNSPVNQENNEDAPQQKKGKKNNVVDENYDSLIEKQRQCIYTLEKAITSENLKTLFQKKQIDEDFFKMLESKTLIKFERVRNSIFTIIRTVMKDLNQVQLNFINLIYEDESLVQPTADFIIDIYNDKNLIFSKEFTFDLLQQLVTFLQEKTNPSSEHSVFKNARDFFSILSNHIPKIFINNLSCFLTLFDSESYLMRNTVCEILGNILKNVLTAQNEEDEEYIGNEESKIKQKEKLLDRLIDRVFDKHAFSRSQVLTILADLCENNAIPPKFLPQILKAAIGRTRDAGAIVRRKALQLIGRVVNYYVYIYQANKDGKFITKDQVIKEIKKLEIQNMSCNEQLQKIDEKFDEIRMSNDPNDDEINDELVESLEQKQKSIKAQMIQNGQLLNRYEEYQEFLTSIEILIPILMQLLGSKSVFDVLETIRLLMYLKKYNITSSEAGIKKMIVLIWSKEKQIKEEVMLTYWSIYMNNKEQKPQKIAKNLVNLMIDTNITEASSFEELYLSMMNSQEISVEDQKNQKSYPIQDSVFSEVWEFFTKNFKLLCEVDPHRERTEQESLDYEKDMITWKKEMRSAIQTLRIFSGKKKGGWNMKLESFKNIIKYYKNSVNKVDWVIVKEIACITEQVKSEVDRKLVESINQILAVLLIKGHGTEDSEWFLSCDQIIRLTFLTFANPEAYIKYLIKRMSKFLFDKKSENNGLGDDDDELGNQNKEDTDMFIENEQQRKNINKGQAQPKAITSKVFENKLAQALYVAGNSALKFLMHCDKIEEYLNKRRIEAENNKTKQIQIDVNDNEDKDIEKIQGGFEAEYEEHQRTLHSIQDKLIIESPIYSYFCSIAQKICWNLLNSLNMSQRNEEDNLNNKLFRRNVILDRVAMLCLIKFMCVSSYVCKKNLVLIFNMLESNADAIIKTNILIGIGDLYHRYPIIIEKYLNFVYRSLSDEDIRVRKTCLMVITHLVLNDMLKVKAEISSIAVLIEDPDQRIQNMVKLFFHELNKKDPKAIYNLLPELIGRLSTEHVNEQTFYLFCENVLPHIDKDKQAESLIEKLCQRFTLVNTEKEWINISHALKMFSYNEKGLKKLLEHFESKYREKLDIPIILENFKAIVQKTKRLPRQSQEQKSLLEELESKINDFRKETFDDKKYKKDKPKPKGSKVQNAQQKQGVAAGGQKKGKQSNANRRGLAQVMDVDSDEEEEIDLYPNKKQNIRQQQSKQDEGKRQQYSQQQGKQRNQRDNKNGYKNMQESEDEEEEYQFEETAQQRTRVYQTRNSQRSQNDQPSSSINSKLQPRLIQRKQMRVDSDEDDFED